MSIRLDKIFPNNVKSLRRGRGVPFTFKYIKPLLHKEFFELILENKDKFICLSQIEDNGLMHSFVFYRDIITNKYGYLIKLKCVCGECPEQLNHSSYSSLLSFYKECLFGIKWYLNLSTLIEDLIFRQDDCEKYIKFVSIVKEFKKLNNL